MENINLQAIHPIANLDINSKPKTSEDFQEEFSSNLRSLCRSKGSLRISFDAPQNQTSSSYGYELHYSQVEQCPDWVVADVIQGNQIRNAWLRPTQMLDNNAVFVTFTCNNTEKQRRLLTDSPLEPTQIIKVGENLHAIWRLKEIIDREKWCKLQIEFSRYFDSDFDLENFNVAVPGTDYIDDNGNRSLVSINFWDDGNEYQYSQIYETFGSSDKSSADLFAEQCKKSALRVCNKNDAEIVSAKFLPDGAKIGKEGVLWQKDEDSPPTIIMTTPMWLQSVIQTNDTREAHLNIQWISFGGKTESLSMPLSYLADKRAMTEFLYQHNITGFSPNKQAESVREYLRRSVQCYNFQCATENAYSRFGWNENDFVLGNDLITPRGFKSANLIRIPSETKEGFCAKGDAEKWTKITENLHPLKQWQHCFTIQAILGSPLLKLLGVDSAILSLAGESGTGKTSIAKFGLAAFGNPKALEIAPQSTEKAFQERWRIAQNLPVLCNEAATIDIKKINNIVYAAANGEPRDTLTQKVELRQTSNWQLLTVFTSNNHLLGIDERFLNEAGKRRILELTVNSPLDGDTARQINSVIQNNYGEVGRVFMEYIVENRSEVIGKLKSAYDWTMEKGIKSEDRFCAWIIAIAKVAGEIAQELDLIRFDTTLPCKLTVESVKTQVREIKTSSQLVEDLIGEFINAHTGYFTSYNNKLHGHWINTDVRGEVVGRYTTEDKITTIAVSRKSFSLWARERGIDTQQISQYAVTKEIEEKPVRLVPNGKPTRCIIIPVDDLETDGKEVLRNILDNKNDFGIAED